MRWPKRRKERKEIERLISGNNSLVKVWDVLTASNLPWDVIVPGMFGLIAGWRMKNEL